MQLSARLPADLAATAVALAVVAPLIPVAPTVEHSAPPTVTREIRLAATVPPGGLITSFVQNQGIYCSIICPLLAQTVTTGITTTLLEPGVFLAALPANGPLKALGIAGASMTGPTAAAMDRAIDADAAIPAKRALNAFEVAVVGLLNIPPAITGGPGAVLNAFQQFRQQTFDALNAPVVRNPEPTLRSTSNMAAEVANHQQTIDTALSAGGPALAVISDNTTAIMDVVDNVGRITRQLAKFPSMQGTDTRSLIADINKLSQVSNDIVLDPNLTLTAFNRLIGVVVKSTNSAALHGLASVEKIAIGALPDKNYAGDPGIHGPDGTDWHLMIGSLRYEWNMIVGRVNGADRP